ncbi:hypothetical protein F5Y18DRAFT_377051 [Xylariaceae sp. FL1019]|nr:hypothetical protein F5Y18DRAFT_377051 [Xylariaceae sp. FL1019]
MSSTTTALSTMGNSAAWQSFAVSNMKVPQRSIKLPTNITHLPVASRYQPAQNMNHKQAGSAATGNTNAWQSFAAENMAARPKAAEPHTSTALNQQGNFTSNNGVQPEPIRFYGPGPGGMIKDGAPVGTLHYARYRQERARQADPHGGGYYHEENPSFLENGERCRPTYTTERGQTAREVNYFRWELVPASDFEKRNVSTFPGRGTARVHDEYLLNQYNFNDPDARQQHKVELDLNNRIGEPLEKIYPRGHALLKKWSKANGHAEWQEGQPLGADPSRKDALTTHLGWFSKRLRNPKAGLGADPLDAIWKEIFHGNVDAKRRTRFVAPKEPWSGDTTRVLTMVETEDKSKTFDILSLREVIQTLPPSDSRQQAISAKHVAEQSKAKNTEATVIRQRVKITETLKPVEDWDDDHIVASHKSTAAPDTSDTSTIYPTAQSQFTAQQIEDWEENQINAIDVANWLKAIGKTNKVQTTVHPMQSSDEKATSIGNDQIEESSVYDPYKDPDCGWNYVNEETSNQSLDEKSVDVTNDTNEVQTAVHLTQSADEKATSIGNDQIEEPSVYDPHKDSDCGWNYINQEDPNCPDEKKPIEVTNTTDNQSPIYDPYEDPSSYEDPSGWDEICQGPSVQSPDENTVNATDTTDIQSSIQTSDSNPKALTLNVKPAAISEATDIPAKPTTSSTLPTDTDLPYIIIPRDLPIGSRKEYLKDKDIYRRDADGNRIRDEHRSRVLGFECFKLKYFWSE